METRLHPLEEKIFNILSKLQIPEIQKLSDLKRFIAQVREESALIYEKKDGLAHQPPSIDAYDIHGNTILMTAVNYAPSCVKLLLDAKANPNLGNEQGETPLFMAHYCCNPALVKLLTDSGAEPLSSTFSVLLKAIIDLEPHRLQKLVEGLGLNSAECNEHGQSLAHFAVHYNSLDCLNYLIEKKHANIPDRKNITPAIAAFLYNKPQAYDLLFANGIDSIHVAAYQGDANRVKRLLETKEVEKINDTHYADPIHLQPILHLAAEGRDLKLVKQLIEEKKADPNALDCLGLTAFETFIRNVKAPYDQEYFDILDYLMSKTAVRYNRTLLHYAVMENNLDLVKIIIEKYKPDFTAKDAWDATALDCARAEIRKYFLEEVKETEIKGIARKPFIYYPHTKRRNSECALWDDNLKKYQSYLKIYETLGSGGFGSVHEFVPKDLSDKKDIEDKDIKLVKQINFRNDLRPIIPAEEAEDYREYHRFGEVDGDRIAIPLVPGDELYYFLQKEAATLSSADLLKIIIAIVDGTENYLNECGKVHLDLHSANVLIERVGFGFKVNLIDFGFATRVGHLTKELIRFDNFGTCMAPECLRPTLAHPSMDVYSIGLMAQEVLSRKNITAHDKFVNSMLAFYHKERPSLQDVRRYFVEALRSTVSEEPKASLPQSPEPTVGLALGFGRGSGS